MDCQGSAFNVQRATLIILELWSREISSTETRLHIYRLYIEPHGTWWLVVSHNSMSPKEHSG